MRSALRQPAVTVPPGEAVKVAVEVTNTLEVIDGVVAAVDAPAGLTASATPALLPLFPDTVGQFEIELQAARTFPAGTHMVPVHLRSSARGDETQLELLQVEVPPAPSGTLDPLPAVRSSHRKGVYTLQCENTGNTTLALALAASDAQHQCTTRFSPSMLTIEPGATASAQLLVRRRCRLLGNEVSTPVVVVATSPELELETTAVLRHKPLIARGARVAFILGAIIAVWAAIFAIALAFALGAGTLTKTVPASFYASEPNLSHAKVAALGGINLDLAAADPSAPAGSVPKTGVVVGVGGTIAGVVDAKSTSQGIGRISVNAYQETPKGEKLIASAATESDGSYAIVGLLPGSYTLEFAAAGYQPVWYPQATSQAGAAPVTVAAVKTTGGIDTTITGHAGSISGTVLTGERPSPPVTVTVTAQVGAGGSTLPVATVTAGPSGRYTIPNLPAPGVYDLAFNAKGFTTSSDSEEIAGGQSEIATTVSLVASDATVSGTVTSGGKPLGGVTVVASANGKTYSTATPTTGAVGSFTLTGLPSPATYLLTFTAPGYGTVTVGQAVGPGQIKTDLRVKMSGGAGTITGKVTSAATGKGLAGVTVTADSGSATTSVQTFNATNSQVGTFELAGLATPGTYTLTFALPGYASETVSVALGSSGFAKNIDVRLPPAAGSISGCVSATAETKAVVGHCINGLPGVTVTLTDGVTTTTSVTASGPPGSSGYFTFPSLSAGTYTLTFSDTGYLDATYVVTVAAGQNPSIPVQLTAGS